MVYIDVIRAEIDACTKQADAITRRLAQCKNSNEKNMMLVELEHTQMYKLSLNKLIYTFYNAYEPSLQRLG